MGEEKSRKFELEKLIAYSDDLIAYLRNEKDTANLKQCLDQSNFLASQCDADFAYVHSSIQDFEEKIDTCKKRTNATKLEVANDVELDLLQKELEEELHRESLLREELRVITRDINDLECQRLSVEDRRQNLKRLEKHNKKSQMKLSMYASITNIIPNLDDQSKISGHIVEREKKVVQNFEFDPLKMDSKLERQNLHSLTVKTIKKISDYVSQLRRARKGRGVWHFNQSLLHDVEADSTAISFKIASVF